MNETEQRFWTHVQKTDGCWVWTGSVTGLGYGKFYHDCTSTRAHRFVWASVHGSIPPGLEVCHHCDNPPCVRPDHLFLGTHVDNMEDRDRKGRTVHGERHYRAQLTDGDVMEIRRTFARGASHKALATQLNIPIHRIANITSGRTWKHLPLISRVPRPAKPAMQFKITLEDAETMRRRYIPGCITMQQLADEYGISLPYAARIIKGDYRTR
jgi:hypothetical protein